MQCGLTLLCESALKRASSLKKAPSRVCFGNTDTVHVFETEESEIKPCSLSEAEYEALLEERLWEAYLNKCRNGKPFRYGGFAPADYNRSDNDPKKDDLHRKAWVTYCDALAGQTQLG